MEHIEYIKKDIKALKYHIKQCKTDNTIYLIPVLKNQLEILERKRFECELKQFKDFI